MTYGDFKTLLAGYLHRTDLTSVIPQFVENARVRLCQDLLAAVMEDYATVPLTAGVGTLSEDIMRIRSVAGANDATLLAVPLGELFTFSSGGVYAVAGLTIQAPGESSLVVRYWGRPVTLIGASDSATRALMTSFTGLWIQAAQCEAAIYLRDDEMLAASNEAYQVLLDAANRQARDLRLGDVPTMRDWGRDVTAGHSGL